MDLVVRNARVADGGGKVEIGVEGETIRYVKPSVPGRGEREIDARGCLVLPSFVEPHVHLDKAFLAGLPRVRIIHGTGMGVLRRTLRAYLSGHPQVASVTEPGQNEGGAGATVVELR